MGREKSNQGGDEGMLGDKYIHQKTKQNQYLLKESQHTVTKNI